MTQNCCACLHLFTERPNKPVEAVEAFEKAVASNPDDANLQFTLGVLYEDAKMEKKVISTMYRVLELEPQHANALNYIGYSYVEKGTRLNEAEELIKKALKIKPESGHITDSLGWLYYKKGRVFQGSCNT